MISNQRNHHFYNWFKWLAVGLIIIIIVGSVYGVYLLKSIEKDKNDQYMTAKNKILNKTELHSIKDLTHFYGKYVYHIALGETQDNQEKVVFLKQNNKIEKENIYDAKSLISEQKIRSLWNEKCDNCNLIKASPAMIKNQPLWELTYWDSRHHYVIEYLSMQDGERYESFSFKQMF